MQVQADLAKMQQLEQGLNDRFQPQLAQLQEQTVQLAELRQALTEAEGHGISMRRCIANLAQVPQDGAMSQACPQLTMAEPNRHQLSGMIHLCVSAQGKHADTSCIPCM